MSDSAVLTEETTCITSDGRAGKLPPGEYAIVAIDGASERGELFVIAPDGNLVAVTIQTLRLDIVARAGRGEDVETVAKKIAKAVGSPVFLPLHDDIENQKAREQFRDLAERAIALTL